MKKYIYLAIALCTGSAIAWGQAQPPITTFPIPTTRINTGSISVTNQNVGMQAGGVDNASLISTLMSAINSGGFGYETIFPGNEGTAVTEYYFSTALTLTRGGTFRCNGSATGGGVTLWFAAGVDGVVVPANGINNTLLRDCQIKSLSYGTGQSTAASASITGVSMVSGSSIPATVWGPGDGIITWRKFVGDKLPNVPTGAYIDSVVGSTLTLHPGFESIGTTIATNTAMWRLPAALMISYNSTSGSPGFTTTAGPALQTGDMIWADAFPLGATVASVTGSPGAQTVTLWGKTLAPDNVPNASVTHTGGSGKMWKLGACIRHLNVAEAINNNCSNFPMGIMLPCTSAGGSNCTGDRLAWNYVFFSIGGMWLSGNNTGASTTIGNIFAHNFLHDIWEGGTIGSVHLGDNSNSGSLDMSQPIMGNCANNNVSNFTGNYIDAGFGGWTYCDPAAFGSSYGIFTDPQSAYPSDVGIRSNGQFFNRWTFSNAGGGSCFLANSRTIGFMGLSKDCGTANTFSWQYNATLDSWDMKVGNAGLLARLLGPSYTPAGAICCLWAFPLGFQLANDNANPGDERHVEMGSAAPTGGHTRRKGDIFFNTLPSSGGFAGWSNLADGFGNFRPFGPIANDTGGVDYTMRTLRSGTSGNQDLTGRITLSGGTATYTLTQTYASAPNCIVQDVTTPANASSVSESTTTLTFSGTGTDVLKWICMGRN